MQGRRVRICALNCGLLHVELRLIWKEKSDPRKTLGQTFERVRPQKVRPKFLRLGVFSGSVRIGPTFELSATDSRNPNRYLNRKNSDEKKSDRSAQILHSLLKKVCPILRVCPILPGIFGESRIFRGGNVGQNLRGSKFHRLSSILRGVGGGSEVTALGASIV